MDLIAIQISRLNALRAAGITTGPSVSRLRRAIARLLLSRKGA